MASLLEVARGVNFGCNVLISFHVGILIILILLLNQLKNQFQDLVVEILCLLDFLREMVLSKFFLWVILSVYFDKYDLCLNILFCLFPRV